MKRDYATYQVALKALLRRGDGKAVFLRLADAPRYLDLPGGRIDNVETKTPLAAILAREIREELGARVRYRLGAPLFQFRRLVSSRNIYNFLTVYDAEFLGGDITLSFEHSAYEWLDPRTYAWKKSQFLSSEEYTAFSAFFTQVKKVKKSVYTQAMHVRVK